MGAELDPCTELRTAEGAELDPCTELRNAEATFLLGLPSYCHHLAEVPDSFSTVSVKFLGYEFKICPQTVLTFLYS